MDDLELIVEEASKEDSEFLNPQKFMFADEAVISSDVDKHELSSNNNQFSLSLRVSDFSDEKEAKKSIKNIELLIRKSLEYKLWTSYIREVLGQYTCALTGEVHEQTSVDIHHHPFTLFLVVKAVIMKYVVSQKPFCSFDICSDVIELHYQNRIGYVPLVSSLHNKYHNGFLKLPMEVVHGDWKYFFNHYDFDDDDLMSVNSNISITKETCGWFSKKNWGVNSYKLDENGEE